MLMCIWSADLFKESMVIPFHLKECHPESFRHIRYLSTQALPLEKRAQLPLTSVAMTLSSKYEVGLYTTSCFLFSPLYQGSGD